MLSGPFLRVAWCWSGPVWSSRWTRPGSSRSYFSSWTRLVLSHGPGPVLPGACPLLVSSGTARGSVSQSTFLVAVLDLSGPLSWTRSGSSGTRPGSCSCCGLVRSSLTSRPGSSRYLFCRVPSGPLRGPTLTWPVSFLGSQLPVAYVHVLEVGFVPLQELVHDRSRNPPAGQLLLTSGTPRFVAPTSSSLPGWWCLGRTNLASSPRYVAPYSS